MRAEDLVAERKTLAGVICDELRARIIALTYRPGAMIYENVIAAEFEVSRTPVRQAFSRLAHERLLKILPQRGARVSALSIVRIREAQFIRESLEISAFAEVAARWDEASDLCLCALKEALDCLAQQKEAIEIPDYARFTKLDAEYHNIFLRVAGNATLLDVVNEMRMHLNRVRYLELQEAHHERAAIVFHEEILDAVRHNDVGMTVTKLRQHLKVLEKFRESLVAKHKDIFCSDDTPE